MKKITKKDDDKIDLTALPADVQAYIAQLERMRSDFVANVSHELRTPLTVIYGYLETLCENTGDDQVALKNIYQQMYQHSIRMGSIIDDLLFLSRLEHEDQDETEQSSINLRAILQPICDAARDISGDKRHQIALNVDADLSMRGNEEELKSLFYNLIINAVKYTPAEGHIEVKAYSEAGELVFSVSDTGIGIAEKHLPRITERFYRVEKARSRENGGTGLGLAIVKHVLMRHGANLVINSTPGVGSLFTCRFPQIS